MSIRFNIPVFLASVSLASACTSVEEDPRDSPPIIAPLCETAACSQAELSASFDCYSPILEQHFTMTAALSGLVDQTSCGVYDVGAEQDLEVLIGPVDPSSDDASAFGFRLRGYEGPGTYPLYHLAEEGDHHGLSITGNNTVTPGTGNPFNTVGTLSGEPSICSAIVHEESEQIPNDPNTVHDFRVRVEIRCPAGGVLTDMHYEEDAQTRCTLKAAPTLTADVLCSN